MIVSYNPLRVFLPLGLFLSVLGGAKLAYDCIADDFAVAINTLVILLAAFKVFSIGLLADLVGRSTRRRDEVPWAVLPAAELVGGRRRRSRAGRAAGPPRSDRRAPPLMASVVTLGAAYSANKGAASMLQALRRPPARRGRSVEVTAVSTHAGRRPSGARAGPAPT